MCSIQANGTAPHNRLAATAPEPSSDPQSRSAAAAATTSPNPPSTLPELSDSDERLLETYLQLNFNLDLLAAHSQTPVLRLIRWLNLPHVQHYLKAIDDLRARQAQAQDQA